jgi:hypothetical protein
MWSFNAPERPPKPPTPQPLDGIDEVRRRKSDQDRHQKRQQGFRHKTSKDSEGDQR